jgi:hypothetical protein
MIRKQKKLKLCPLLRQENVGYSVYYLGLVFSAIRYTQYDTADHTSYLDIPLTQNVINDANFGCPLTDF